MSKVESAIAEGRCALAVSGALLRDEQVMLALKEREALHPMTLAGPATGPVEPVGDRGLARAIGQDGGVLVLVEPGPGDQAELQKLARQVGTAPHKPTIVVVAKRFNAFQMQMLFRGLTVEHEKERGQAWLAALPIPPAEAEAPVPEVKKASERRKKGDADAPSFAFVGREDELAAITEALGTGGPIVVSGPRGVGRTWLVEHGLAEAGLARAAEVVLGRGVGFDTLISVLATLTKDAGVETLHAALTGEHTPTALVEAAIEALTAAEGLADRALVIHHLQIATGRNGDFFRKSRLELLVQALLSNTYALRVVFTSVVQPVFFREGRAEPIRRIELEGIKGRFFHEIFEAYHAPEFPRDKFGPISERLHGHPMAARTFAIAARHASKVVDDEKFFKMKGLDDVGAIGKQVEKRVGRLDRGPRGALAAIAHFRIPVDGQTLADLDVKRRLRTKLVAEGVLDMVGTATGTKRYRVHPIVARTLSRREVEDFGLFQEVAAILERRAESLEGAEKQAVLHEANRAKVLSRHERDVTDLGVPDQDAVVESTFGLLRSKNPRHDLAEQRIAAMLKADPANADAHLQKLELLRRKDGATAEEIKEAQEAAMAQAPVPEVFHEVVGELLGRNALGQAVKVLERGVEALPDESRLRCRLASMLMRQGRRPDAIEHLEKAMTLDPMLPDAYGLLGTLRRDEGADKLDETETLLREAVRLAPNDPVQTSRLVRFLLDVHKGVPERREAVAEEIKALLDGLIQADGKSWEAHLDYAVALRELGGDGERARWFLKKAKKLAPKRRYLQGRFDTEHALIEAATGDLDKAESSLRKLAKKDPSNHRIVAGLSEVLTRRGQLVAAHAELMRAAERVSPGSLDRQAYDLQLARLQEAITSGAAALAGAVPPTPAPETSEATPAPEKPKTVTRHAEARPADAEAETEPAPAESEATDTAPPETEATETEAAPTETETESSETETETDATETESETTETETETETESESETDATETESEATEAETETETEAETETTESESESEATETETEAETETESETETTESESESEATETETESEAETESESTETETESPDTEKP